MITKHQLTTALFNGGPLSTDRGTLKIVNAVAREDGSGHCFNVSGLLAGGKQTTLFVRTID